MRVGVGTLVMSELQLQATRLGVVECQVLGECVASLEIDPGICQCTTKEYEAIPKFMNDTECDGKLTYQIIPLIKPSL